MLIFMTNGNIVTVKNAEIVSCTQASPWVAEIPKTATECRDRASL